MPSKNQKTSLPSQADIDSFELLQPLVESALQELREFSKRKQNDAVNPLKAKMLNRLLNNVRQVLSNDPSVEFLDVLDEDTLPTNSDAVLIMSQYNAALEQYKTKNQKWDSGRKRWVTKENP